MLKKPFGHSAISWLLSSGGIVHRVFKKVVQRGRSERRDEAYVELLSDARTKPGERRASARQGRAGETVDFFNTLVGLPTMIRSAILGGGAIALVLLALVCVPRHLPQPVSSTLIPASFHARLEQGTLTLRGSLPDSAGRDKIVREAHARYGDANIRIVDELTVDSQVAPAPWLDKLPGILPVLRQMNGRGSVIVDGRSVVLSGRVATEQAKAALLRTVGPMTATGLELEDHVLASLGTASTRPLHASLQSRLNAVLARGKIEFESNQASLTPAGRATLDQLILVLRDAPQAVIEIGGHTDEYGAPDYNMDLSRRRAEAVREYFVKEGLTQRFLAVGYGSTKPRSTEQTRAALQRNRRIELHVKGNGDV